MLDDFDLDIPEDEDPDEDEAAPEGNRTFVLVAGGLGALLLISLVCIAIYAFFILPGQGDEQTDLASTAAAQQAALDQSLTETAAAALFTSTATATLEPSASPTSSETATDVAPLFSPTEGGPTEDPRTATVEALLTQAALAQTQSASSILTVTPTATSSSSLPDTGFIDDLGAPALLALTIVLLVVIFMSRRLRDANS